MTQKIEKPTTLPIIIIHLKKLALLGTLDKTQYVIFYRKHNIVKCELNCLKRFNSLFFLIQTYHFCTISKLVQNVGQLPMHTASGKYA